jgi:hypothetical protein
VLRANLKWKLSQLLIGSCLVLMLTIGISSCDSLPPTTKDVSIEPLASSTPLANNSDGPLAEVNTPASILQLAPSLDKYQPQVQIVSPKPDEILADDRVTVKLKVSDLPLFKQPELGLGNHLHVILDKQTYQGVYDLNQPLVFKNLSAGTHTLRVFASRPWHESFKNQGAFDLVTFHVLTKTAENQPDLQQPILTYSRPAGTYGAEPMMLDYYLTNIPDLGNEKSAANWRVRVTVNDQQFTLDRWAPIYLQGFKKGKNWVRLELVDDLGNPIPNVYNDTLAIFTYDPQNRDALAKLIGGELSPDLARMLVEPNYVASQPTPEIATTPVSKPIPTPKPTPIAIVPLPEVKPTPKAGSHPAPIVVPIPIEIVPPSGVKPKPSPTLTPEPIVKTLPSDTPVEVPAPIVKTVPNPVSAPIQQPIERVDNAPKPPIELPTPTATPIVIVPVPTIVAKDPAPTKPLTQPLPQKIAPEPTKNLPPANPEPITIVIPNPISSPTVNREPSKIEIVPPQVKLADKSIAPSLPVKPSPQNPPPAAPAIPAPPTQILVPFAKRLPAQRGYANEQKPLDSITPTATNPPAVETSEKTWQTQISELFNTTKTKIRTFTNTIPAKAQRFGHNLQIWSAKAMELIEQLRDSPKDRLRQRG